MASIHEYTVNSLTGKPVNFSEFSGKVLLLVNTASKCGLTPQYEALEALYDKYQDKGLVVIGFPSNDFGAQEPGSAEEISEFCSVNYGVSFPMMEKNPVKGEATQPVYQFLKASSVQGHAGGEITWNFEKFLVDKAGKPVARFSPRTAPDDAEVVKAIETLLAQP